MANSIEPSSSLSFTSSSHLSNGSISHNQSSFSAPEKGVNLEVFSLNKLSSSLEQLLIDSTCEYSDAEIIVEGIPVCVHRCILAARSKFFYELFKREKGSVDKEGKPKYPMSELLPYGKRRLLNFVGKAVAEDIIPILLAAFHCQLSQLLAQCVDRIVRSDLDTISIEKELPTEVAEEIRMLRLKSFPDDENTAVEVDPLREKRIKRIHKALDSDDVELVRLLLSESEITLDEANALHYAAAYCDPKVLSEVLSLGLADVNLRSSRGYTVLHIGAMRKEPSVIVSLLTKGACASDLTLDGRSAVSICRRLTRPKDYQAKTEQGKETNKDRICIDVLEGEMRRNPMAGDAFITSHTLSDDLHMKLLYLENRAKLAMDIANTETTSEFSGFCASKGSSGNLREVDLNETPVMRNKRLRPRMEALMKTVEMGQRYFPLCSEVLDKFMEDDLQDLFFLENGTKEEQRVKRMRFIELKDDVQKAFTRDKAEISRSGLCSSSSSSSFKDGVKYKLGKL
ncbi:Regulatory protein NPR3 [Citrus sinensis]|nr:Regulatory protein NPR3 [Citrus sinensis]